MAINPQECPIGATALCQFFDGRIDLPSVEIGDGVSFDFDSRRKGCVRLDGRLNRAPLAHMRGLRKELRLVGPVRLLATALSAIERIAPDRLKRHAANRTGAKLHPVIAPSAPHVAIFAKAEGVYAQRSAFDAKALALMLIQDVAIAAKAAGVYARLAAFDTKKPALALTVPHVAPHVTIYAKTTGVYARCFAFDAKAPALAVTERGGGGHHLLIFDDRSRTSLMVVAHIASPTHTPNEIGIRFAALRTLCSGRSGMFLMVVAHIASPTHTPNEIGTESATPWTFVF
jgi:hypothetical protein